MKAPRLRDLTCCLSCLVVGCVAFSISNKRGLRKNGLGCRWILLQRILVMLLCVSPPRRAARLLHTNNDTLCLHARRSCNGTLLVMDDRKARAAPWRDHAMPRNNLSSNRTEKEIHVESRLWPAMRKLEFATRAPFITLWYLDSVLQRIN
jgi:hypothetical protein